MSSIDKTLLNANSSAVSAETPTVEDFLRLSSAAYTGETPDGWQVISEQINETTGMHAVAYQDDSGRIVLAYEGTNPDKALSDTNFFGAEINADKAIMQGQDFDANNGSVSFAMDVAEKHPDCASFTITGHSLGGEEAQFVAQKCSFISGGATFGAPGVPNLEGNATGNIVNYVNVNDPIGNFVPNNGAHVGSVEFIGTKMDAVDTLKAGGGVETHLLKTYAESFNVSLEETSPAESSLMDKLGGFISNLGNESAHKIHAQKDLGGSALDPLADCVRRNLDQLEDYARRNPGKLASLKNAHNSASASTGSVQAGFDIPDKIPTGSFLDHIVTAGAHTLSSAHTASEPILSELSKIPHSSIASDLVMDGLSDIYTAASHIPVLMTLKVGIAVGGIYGIYQGNMKSAARDMAKITLGKHPKANSFFGTMKQRLEEKSHKAVEAKDNNTRPLLKRSTRQTPWVVRTPPSCNL
ncbi:MAG: hypothetical protein PHW76_08880 [Alphaproteobacteria bacterium]|nr:hypothetical protein [Alphaproteobacteria bacterium]